jgi:hypothetical protein
MSKTPELRTELLFTATIAVDPMIDLGPSALGDRRLVPIVSGAFAGPRMKGEILSGGIDWQLLRADKVARIEAHYVLKTDDEVLIRVINRGFRYGPPEVMQRLAAGDPVDPAEYYFRAAPTFDAPSGRYDFLNRALFVSTGERYPDRVVLHFFEIL